MYNMNKIIVAVFSLTVLLTACKKEEYTFGDLVNPSGLTLTTSVIEWMLLIRMVMVPVK